MPKKSLEDNIRKPNGELAKGNREHLEWAKKLANHFDREMAQGDEAREKEIFILNFLDVF